MTWATIFCVLLNPCVQPACTHRYVDVTSNEKEGPSVSDLMSQSLLIFLLSQPEELPSLKRDKSLKEMVAEKLQKKQNVVDIVRRDSASDVTESKDSSSSRMRAQSVHLDGKLLIIVYNSQWGQDKSYCSNYKMMSVL